MYSKRLAAIMVATVLICSIIAGCSQESVSEAGNFKLEDIRQDNLMNIVEELTSEKYEGRMAGSEGNFLATQYIADYYKKIGLENPKGLSDYRYRYLQPLVELKDKPVMQLLDKNGKNPVDFDYPENFVLRRLDSETSSIDITAPMYIAEDIDTLYKDSGKLKGKILLIPWKFYDLLGSQNEPADFAQMCGALGAISEFDLEKNNLGYKYLKVRPLFGTWTNLNSYKPFAFVDSGTFSQMTKAAQSGGKLHFKCSSETDTSVQASNCVGLIPGSDTRLKDEFIIIGAHYDHVGTNMDGTWNPGALDNASGTAVMMELARVIKESKIPPRKSILFLAFNGEEGGAKGSWRYCQKPVYPMDKAVMINLDMVGSAAKMPLSIAVATEKSDTTLRDTLGAYADELSIKYDELIEDGSDHAPFSYYGVPSVCLINMDMGHGYHSPNDTIETVSGEKLEEAAKLVLYYIKKNAY